MTKRPIKIAYLCDHSPLDPNLYSGGNARMYQALQQHVGEVSIVPQSWYAAEPLRRVMHALPDALNLRARWRLHLALGRLIAKGVRRELARGAYDVAFCAYSIQSLAGRPVPDGMISAFTSDATQTIYKQSEVGQSFGSYFSASRYLDPWVARHEARILAQTDVLLWPTQWLCSGAEDLLNVPHGKAHVVPWGANIAPVPRPKSMPALNSGRPIRLLFVGRDWFAKGGPMARAVLEALIAQGCEAQLTVIGTSPPEAHMHSAMDVIGPLDKSVPGDMKRFEQAFVTSHFLINPSFESYGFAYCEAAAYGLPALSLRVGGVPVRDGINGHAFDPGASADKIAVCIMKYLREPKRYAELRASSRAEYETRLNWDAWGQSVAHVLQSALRERRR